MLTQQLARSLSVKRPSLSIVYATATGTARTFAMRVKSHFEAQFNVELFSALQFEEAISKSRTCLFVASTFGSGDAPHMAQNMTHWLNDQLTLQEEFKNKLEEDVQRMETNFAAPQRRRLSVLHVMMKKDPSYKSVIADLKYV